MTTSEGFRIGYSLRPPEHRLVDLPNELDEAESLQVDTVEIPLLAMNLIAGGKPLEPQLRRLTDACANRRLAYSVHAPIGINFTDVEWRLPMHRDVALASLEVSAAIGARRMVIHTGLIRDAEYAAIEAAYGRQREALKWIGDHAARRNIVICVENIWSFDPHLHTALPSRLAAELEAIDHDYVRATFDFSHAFLQCGMQGADILEEARSLIPYSPHLHIHDSFGRPRRFRVATDSEAMAYGVGDLHLPVGWGAIPWADLMQCATYPRDVWFDIELKETYWPELSETIAATRLLAEKARQHDRNADAG